MNYVFIPYHTFLSFKDPERERSCKILWEKEKILVTSIFSFSALFFLPQAKTEIINNILFVPCRFFNVGQVHNFAIW